MEKKTVFLTDLRAPEMRDAADFLRGRGYEIVANDAGAPLCDEDALRALAERMGPLAGVIHPAPPRIHVACADATEEQWAQARDEGIMAAWAVTKVFCEKMAHAGDGAMIYLGSIHAEKPIGNGFLFSLGCGATQMLCREASQDYAERGVRCFYVQRGPTDGEEDNRSALSDLYYGVDMRYPRRKAPERGFLNDLLAFLLTPGSWPLNGADLRADGGMTMFYGHRRRVEGVAYHDYRRG